MLIVDDLAHIRRGVADSLSAEGYQTAEAANGLEALAFLKGTHRPALIILDLSMPSMGGREFLARQKADRKIAAIPIIVFSSEPHLSDELLRGSSVAALISKDDPHELLTAVRRILA